jgi:hypothetical protein
MFVSLQICVFSLCSPSTLFDMFLYVKKVTCESFIGNSYALLTSVIYDPSISSTLAKQIIKKGKRRGMRKVARLPTRLLSYLKCPFLILFLLKTQNR